MTLASVLLWVSIPFTVTTLAAAFYRGENNYYESDAYDGHGTAHPVQLEETTCERREVTGR